jgi:hypothetical protein
MARTLTNVVAGLLASGLALRPVDARETNGTARVAKVTKASPRELTAARDAAAWHARRGPYFERSWGVDIVGIRPVSSGLMLRLDYRVVDPELASVLTDRTARPYVIDEATHTALAIPAMENIGELRQIAPLEQSRTYYMIFGNPGRLVKPGSRVTLVVGNLRADGLVVN